MHDPIRLTIQRLEWRRRERRLDLTAAVLLCVAVSLVYWTVPLVA
ncbi:hypothetical protein [Rubrivivax gelatinosus]|uniref:Uncharacterized protein n=1 Tax=Rubrivivax gelatinosus (strain NBRC 100245 / IL144) TaxID=983917 RepID=I0HT89_RUBGI|nr:hypothetical protein [Rubrivivax gelatinosus]BAL96226.1 hypothetical protein RGE_28870 [Rubrivivax gelatinosus IL144]